MLRGLLRLAVGTATLAAGGWVLRALHGAPAALGATPAAIRAVAQRSPNYRDGAFVNADPVSMFSMDREQRRLVLRELIGGRAARRPAVPVPLPVSELSVTNEASNDLASGLAATWLGHSTVLLEIDGYRVLTDPVWSERASPSDTVGPRRVHPPPVPLEALPAVDVVVISHDHYDHLDIDTVTMLARTQRAPFVVPLGVGAHLRDWGLPEHRIIELDWGESTRIDDLRMVCAPARHFSGRFLSRNPTLWASWVLCGPGHRVYFAGDTGYTASFSRIGSDHGPFDLTLMPVGAYNPAWPDIHMTPEEAVRAHLDVNAAGAGVLLPVHWCTFRLAPHAWDEPIQRLMSAAGAAGVQVTVPEPGRRIDPAHPAGIGPWWQWRA